MIEQMKRSLQRQLSHETFKFALELFQQAAKGQMPGSHLPKPDPDGPPGYYFTNIPINRGMLAVMRETRHLDDEERQALGLRLMHFGEAIGAARAEPRFGEHFKPSDSGEERGVVMISDPFTRAYAEARFKVADEHLGVDLDDLYRLADKYRVEDEADEESSR